MLDRRSRDQETFGRLSAAGDLPEDAGIVIATRSVACNQASRRKNMGWLARLRVPLGWGDVIKRTFREAFTDNVFGWAAELAYYFFLALFPALLFLVALASFFPIHDLMDKILGTLGRVAPGEVLSLVRDQILQISKNNNGGLLTLGLLGTIWSASSGMSSVSSVLNRAYHVEEARSWIRVRITAILLTIALAVFVLVSFALVVAGPEIADKIADSVGLGTAFRWTWKTVQWPVVFALVVTGVGLVYYFAPDVKQEWKWITPGSVAATIIWLIVSLGFRWYVSAFANYQKTYGAIGAAIVALLWFYVSGVAMLLGAEMNALIEHSSPEGKDPGEKVAGENEEKQQARAGAQWTMLAPAQQSQPAFATRRSRTSELVIGGAALVAELAAVIAMHVRRVRTRS
jgi:membrane protein